jgi:hypothetical protein
MPVQVLSLIPTDQSNTPVFTTNQIIVLGSDTQAKERSDNTEPKSRLDQTILLQGYATLPTYCTFHEIEKSPGLEHKHKYVTQYQLRSIVPIQQASGNGDFSNRLFCPDSDWLEHEHCPVVQRVPSSQYAAISVIEESHGEITKDLGPAAGI